MIEGHSAEKQRDLRRKCHHPTSVWQPLDQPDPDTPIPEHIAARALEIPDHLAVFDTEVAFTFSESDCLANQISHAILTALGPGQEAVALLVGLHAPAAAAALGVMKAGKFYVAVEETYSRNRALDILEDSKARLIITDEEHYSAALDLARGDLPVISLQNVAEGNSDAPHTRITMDAIASLNYTSGSTGKPKAVVFSHRFTLFAALQWYGKYNICPADRYANFTALPWGVSLAGIFGALCYGAAAGNFDLRRHSWQQLADWLIASGATMLLARTIIHHLAELDPQPRFPAVRLVTLGGDTILRRDVEVSKRLFPEAAIQIHYGSNETARITDLLLDRQAIPERDVMPVGFPAEGVDLHLLAENGQIAGEGEVGEIIVQSKNLADGYWRRPQLTAAKFHSGGFWGQGRAYYTGDLGRFFPDGTLLHLGRKDFMVKIRGYQVFTNEIEALLLKVKGVEEAAVTRYQSPDGDQRLVAYLVVDDRLFPGSAALHEQLQDVPPYMRPGIFEYLAELPRTVTGKLDRRQLPEPERSRLNVTAKYRAPSRAIEEYLCKIWGAVLEIEDVGVDDDFLELGGDSLRFIRIVNEVNRSLQLQISNNDLFSALTVAELARIVETKLGRRMPCHGQNDPVVM